MADHDAVCWCGHPRHVHEHLSDTYPAICSYAEPVVVGNEPDDPHEGVCLCLDFEPEEGDRG